MVSTPQVGPTRRDVLRRGLVAAAGSSLLFDALGRRAAHASPAPSARAETGISMVGDSLTVGCIPYQSDDFGSVGWSDAAVNAFTKRSIQRKAPEDKYTGLMAVDAIRKSFGDTNTWVVALGTNDCVIDSPKQYTQTIVQMLGKIGADHRVLWVNVFLPSAKTNALAWNQALGECASAWQGEMAIYDWAKLAADHPDWLAKDHIHYHPAGYQYRAALVAQASVDAFTPGNLLRW